MRPVTRVVLAVSLLLAVITFWLGRSRSPEHAESVMLVVIDTLRRDHVGAYHEGASLTPNLDSLAADGLVFEQAVATSSWTRASIASMFTGQYPSELGVLDRNGGLDPDALTLPEMFAGVGIETLGILSNANAGSDFGFDQGFSRWSLPDLHDSYADDFGKYTGEGVTKKALELVDGLRPSQRFFLFVHYLDPHDPYLPRPSPDGTATRDGRFDGSRRDLDRMDQADDLSPADLNRIRELYRGEVAYTDRWLGELMAGLRARGLDGELLVVVTADHGEGLWDHGERAHGLDLHEEVIGVPLVLRFPHAGREHRARRVSAPVSLVDLAPTIAAAAGLPAPPEFAGRDLAADGSNAATARTEIYSELNLDGRDLEALRRGPLKLIRSRSGQILKPTQLFDLEQDPREVTNLVAERPQETARVFDDLATFGEALRRAASRSPAASDAARISPETVERLRALGYVDSVQRPTAAPVEALDPIVDMSAPSHAARQLVTGFYAKEGDSRWIAPHAEAILRRESREAHWRVDGWVDPTFLRGVPLVLLIRANAARPLVVPVAAGRFSLSGALPDDGLTQVLLTIDCSTSFVPKRLGVSADERELCAAILRVGLER